MRKTSVLFIAIAVLAVSCKDSDKNEEAQIDENNAMENESRDNDLVDLSWGEDLDGWKAYNSDEITKWTIEDGVIAFTPSEESSGSENLITDKEYTNFELSLDWKISEGGNSGIMWGVQEGEQFSEPYTTGPEIQILDNEKHPDAENGPIRQAGALYDMVPPSEDVTKPAGEWNETVIRIDHEENRGTVTMNGTKITEFPLHGEEWEKLVENSKFSDWEDFGKYKTGHIALQDHSDKVWFRNIRIKELD